MAEIGGFGTFECGRWLGVSTHHEDHTELEGDVVRLADAKAAKVEFIEFAGRGKLFDSYAKCAQGVHILVTGRHG